MEDEKLGILLLVIAILLLGFSFYVNFSGAFEFLNNPNFSNGFGALCDSEENCRIFCQNNKERCDDYCRNNPENELCGKLLGGAG